MKLYIVSQLIVISAIIVLFNTKYVVFAAKQGTSSKGGGYITETDKTPTPDCDFQCRNNNNAGCGSCCRSYYMKTNGVCKPENPANIATGVKRCYCSYLKLQGSTPKLLKYCSGSCASGYSGERNEKCKRCCNGNVVGVNGGSCRGTRLLGTYGCYCTPQTGNTISRSIASGHSKIGGTRSSRKFWKSY